MADPASWGSLLGVSVILFVMAGAFQILIGVFTPITLATFGWDDSSLAVSQRSDAQAYGSAPEEIMEREPAVRTFRNVVWTIVAGLLTGLGLLEIVVALFGARTAQVWAVATLTAVALVLVVFWLIALVPYFRSGAPMTLADLPPFMWVPALLHLPAVALAWWSIIRGGAVILQRT